jgi:hypothetical protein
MLPVRRPCYNAPLILKLPNDQPGTGILQGYDRIQHTPWRERRMATIPRYDSFEDFYARSPFWTRLGTFDRADVNQANRQ